MVTHAVEDCVMAVLAEVAAIADVEVSAEVAGGSADSQTERRHRRTGRLGLPAPSVVARLAVACSAAPVAVKDPA